MIIGIALSRRMSRVTLKKIVFSAIVCTIIYAVAEIVCSTIAFIAYSRTQNHLDSFWIFEDSGRTIHFDPRLGCRLTTTPSRFARIDYGEVEYVGTLRGNAQGFPDEDDFTIEKPASISKRYVVFGDFFTSAQFIQRNWPDYVEELVDDQWQLLNFSMDGGGLANWWSNLANVVDEERYECDGVIFAAFCSDVERKFAVSEHRGYDRHMFGRVDSWNPEDFPTTLEQAKEHLQALNGYILKPDEFEAALRDKRLTRPRRARRIYQHLWIAYNSYKVLRSVLPTGTNRKKKSRSGDYASFSDGQLALMLDIRERLNLRNIRPLVVYIPSKNELLSASALNRGKSEAKLFARILGGRFVDGAAAFEDLTPEQIREHWLPHDGHWAQRGSDRFGRFLMKILEE